MFCKWFDSEDNPVWVNSNDIVVLEENNYDQINNDPLNSYVATNVESLADNVSKKPSLFSLITIPEITNDVSKWVFYDLLLPDSATAPNVKVSEVALYGGISGLIGNAFYEVLKLNQFNQSSVNRFVKAGIEGAALFVAYESSISLINSDQNFRKMLGDKLPFIPYI